MIKRLAIVLLFFSLPAPIFAGSYVQQSAFPLSFSTLAGMDTDALGNIYALGLVPGATTYHVTGYGTPAISPEFSFDTGLSSPIAYAVEGSGTVDVLDNGNGIRLQRFQNTGAFISQTSYSLNTYNQVNFYTAAIDKANSRVYIAYQYTYHPIYPACLGCGGPSTVTRTQINQYDFQGNIVTLASMPGADSSPGTCYTPTAITVDPQGNLYIADGLCNQVLKFTPTGSLTSSTPASNWSYNFSPRGLWTDPAANLYVSESVCGPTGCQPGVVKLGPSVNFITSFAVNSPVGCAWDSRILYLSSSGGPPLQRFIYDDPPTVPAESSPIGAVTQHSSFTTLGWQASSNPEGDAIAYNLYLGQSPGQLSLIGGTAQSNLTTPGLSFGTTYYWQVVAQSSYLGLPILQSSAPVVSFNMSFVDSPPGPFGAVSGTGTATTRSSSVVLVWQPSADAYGDPITYDVFWSTSPQMGPSIGATAATSWPQTGLSFGTTYYWTVRARDPYGATTMLSGGTQAYHLVFLDTPPSTPIYLSTATSYSLHTTSPTVTLSWQPSSNAQGDPITYQLSLAAGSGPSSQTSLGSATSILVPVSFGTTYYWQVSAADPYGGVSTGPLQNFVVNLANQPPYPVVYLSTATTLITRATTYALSWQATGDPDGDPVVYALYLSTTPAGQPVVQQGTQTSYTLALQFGTTYYWRVSATDNFGASANGPLQTFLPIFRNDPPAVPAILGGTGLLQEHTLAPHAPLSWSAVQNPEGDPITYQLYFGSNPGGLAQVQSSTQTSADVSGLQFGATYYWQVGAANPYGAASTSPVQSLIVALQDNPPGPFSVTSGTGTFTTRASSAALAWTAAVDPDGDAVSYALSLSTNPSVLPVVQVGSATAFALNFAYGTTYYWTVSAFDAFGGTTPVTGGMQSFLPVFLNDPPRMPNLISPFGNAVIKTMKNSAAVSWQQVTDPEGDPITYTVYLGNSASGLAPLATIDQSRQGGTTALALKPDLFRPQSQVSIDSATITLNLTDLDYYKSYFIRISASNPYGATASTPVQSFSLASADGFPKAYNYPNPFSPLRGGTNIVFNAPPSGYGRATVEVYSELQDLLFKQDYYNIAPGISQVHFDGRDRYGRPFFNGSYIVRVLFSDPDDKQVFYLLVVK